MAKPAPSLAYAVGVLLGFRVCWHWSYVLSMQPRSFPDKQVTLIAMMANIHILFHPDRIADL